MEQSAKPSVKHLLRNMFLCMVHSVKHLSNCTFKQEFILFHTSQYIHIMWQSAAGHNDVTLNWKKHIIFSPK